MCLLIRKIERTKWLQNDITNGAEVSADAITNCLKTKNNSLSVWRIEDDSAVEDAVLAIVSNSQHPDTIHVALLHEREVLASGFQLEAKLGVTRVERLRDTHCDICGLTYGSLGLIARLIVECFQQERVHTFTSGMIKNLLKKAIEEGELEEGDLEDSMRSKLR